MNCRLANWLHRHRSFSLLEVVIAVAIFFTAIFAIMQLVSTNLSLVRILQEKRPDLGTIAGKCLMGGRLATNWVEGVEAPYDEDFGFNEGNDAALYPEAGWERDWMLVATNVSLTNGLYRADIKLTETIQQQEAVSIMSILMYRPNGLEYTTP
ncbi:MAG: hypothetical protein QF685_03590 [Verrucomicrobiota bacterium]|jgi:hypothetical protein|nr:hypothetical protein [Verrucomicrobiota bacterium]